ncbi:hypothetical protein AWB68_05127 [Caballeronia choica]|uniref:Uncharacterized protein n=1 Tax=Caballeronia choica TaxID=326476 RepID=A0A158K7L5_9BURK|nr:hypothetical protein AWB68_05127 [Caballeronia choica]
MPDVPSSVTLSFVPRLSYATKAFVGLPLESVFTPIAFNWLTFTASVPALPAATLASTTGVVEPLPPNVTLPFVVSSYATNEFVTLPLESTVAPRPCNWPRLTASFAAVPAATLWICVPFVPPSETAAFVASSYATNEFVTLPLESVFRPASANCLTFTASEGAVPAATFVIATGVVEPVPPSVILLCAGVS